MVFKLVQSLICASLLSAFGTFATPVMDIQDLEARQAADNIVYITDANTFWRVPYYVQRSLNSLFLSISQHDNASVSRPTFAFYLLSANKIDKKRSPHQHWR